MIVGLDHIGIAVKSIIERLPFYERLLGFKLERMEKAKSHQIKVAFLRAGGVNIELIEPFGKDSTVAKFLERRGEGIHHIALKVTNLDETINQLKAEGANLIDETPRRGVKGDKIAFLHPKNAGRVLIELCEE